MSTRDAGESASTPPTAARPSGAPPAVPVRCPCLSGETYAECCAPYHRGEADAPTAERLMRSRYSAFAVGDEAYLLASWHPQTRPAPNTLALDPCTRWLRLDILRTTGGGPFDTTGTVEFEARYREAPPHEAAPAEAAPRRAQTLHERSSFVKEHRRWLYVSGEQ